MLYRWLSLGLFFTTLLQLTGCAPLVIGGAAATTASVAHDRRTTGAVIEDQSIEMRIRSGLAEHEDIKRQTHINITSYNGIVLLSGEAPSESLRNRIGDIARKDPKARRVHNEIQLAAPSSMMTRSSDSLITSKVKTGLVGQEASRVKVVTENGTVFLMGLLHHAEAAVVTDRTRQVGGVQRIVKLFEYLD